MRRHMKACKAARALALIGHEKQQAHFRAVARKMRSEIGLPPAKALGG
jgi:hypothetical protein